MTATSLSLLERIRQTPHDVAWNEVAGFYGPLLRQWLCRLGIDGADQDDLAQEVLLTLVRELSRFEHSGRIGAFRHWLRTILVHRVRDFWRARQTRPQPIGGSDWQTQLDQLADDQSDASHLWNAEHDRHVLSKVMELVRPRVEPKTWDAFQRQVFGGQRADQVAAALGLSLSSVYVARSRVLALLRQEAAGLVDSDYQFPGS